LTQQLTKDKIMKNRSASLSLLIGTFVVMVLAASSSTVRAQSCTSTTTWTDGNSSWFNSLNWNNGTPDSTKCAYINNGGQAGVHGGNAVAQNIILGNSQNQSGLVTVDTDHTSILDAGTSSGDVPRLVENGLALIGLLGGNLVAVKELVFEGSA
jgi:hypothetical protein